MRPYSVWSNRNVLRRGKTNTVIIVLAVIGGILALGVVLIVVAGLFLMRGSGYHHEASLNTQSKNNLKQIGLAMHNYHDVHSTFPPSAIIKMPSPRNDTGDSTPADGIPQHGWMSMILPYIEQGPLFQQIDFHSPWTTPENTVVYQTEIRSFLHPGHVRDDSRSTIAAGLAAAHYAVNSQLLKNNAKTRFGDITDGASMTIMAGEVTTGFQPWGSPYNSRDPAAGLGNTDTQFEGRDEKVVQFLLCDGSVRSISRTIAPNVLGKLATPNEGVPVGEF